MTISGGALSGQWLGEYQLQALLAVGGMAEIYQARDAVINRTVAVKVLPLALAADPTYVERFRHEAQAVGALNHPNIVPVHAFGEQGPLLYLVMPLMQESLRDRLLRAAPLSVEEAVQIAVQILSGLGAAHAQGVVHRDVKPENILLDEHGVAKLTDFGIARRITVQRGSGGPTLAGSGLPVGTPQYMAPEQLRGEDLDQRADIYALGAVLYEMLTGLPPHIADTPYEVASLVLTAPLTPPARRNPLIWPELEQVMQRALGRKPAERYATATSFAEALQDALLAHEIELLAPASAIRSSYVKFRTSQPLAKSAPAPVPGSGAVVDHGAVVDTGAWIGPPTSGAGSSDAPQRDPPEPPTRRLPPTPPSAPPSEPPRNAAPASAALDGSEQEALSRGAPDVATGLPKPHQSVRSEPLSPPVGSHDPQGVATSGQLLSRMATVPPATGGYGDNGGIRRRRRRSWVMALTLIVALGLLSALAVSTGATRFLPRFGFTATPALAAGPTATMAQNVTPTSATAATATITAQQQRDRQASDSFRAITLATAKDSSCTSNTATFSAEQTLYINMCTSSQVAPGSASVSIRQIGNVCTLLPDKDKGLTPSAGYYCSSTLSLEEGAYDIVISMNINGTPATARTLRFTVGG